MFSVWRQYPIIIIIIQVDFSLRSIINNNSKFTPLQLHTESRTKQGDIVGFRLSYYYPRNRPWRPIELWDIKDAHCPGNRLTDGGKVVSPTHRQRFTPKKHFSASGIHFC
jgi:hypothetical protein